MSKAGSKDLFILIKHLSKSEKRHFKIYASRHVIGQENNYVKLFDAIDKQQEYNEKLLLKKEQYAKQLHLMKNRLYDTILKSIAVYHSNADSSAETLLRNQLHYIEMLFNKGLLRQCSKLIKKTKNIAYKFEKHQYLLKLLEWDIELLKRQSYPDSDTKDLKYIFDELFSVNTQWKNYKQYNYLNDLLHLNITKQGYVRRASDLNIYHTIMDHPLLHLKEKNLSFHEKRYYEKCFLFYAFVQNNYEDMYHYSWKLLKLFEDNPHQINESPQAYYLELCNLILCQFRLKKLKEIPVSITKLKHIQASAEVIRNQIFYSVIQYELDLYMDTGEFAKGEKLIRENQKQLALIEEKILNQEKKVLLYYACVSTCFGAGNYTMANFYVNKILNNYFSDFRNDVYCFSLILSLLIHFELGTEDLLEYTVKSTYRFLYKRKRLYQFESILLNFIREKLPEINAEYTLIMDFQELKTTIAEVIKDPFERKALDYFDFISWLESKIEGRPFAEVVRKKAGIH